ncbi:hypothetical protein DICPUDRAFT_151089 [Dictyostelium purpureum]|uniref:WW domain-containing protein n=1 Tax=Dictyostelium purpureum TaxID=5786 RepID=F0ZHZ0_DICPU|nr:uncharacterized protein DICPUDRAFT_151089 [Dictyostelium purpureum]EGC36463.1 hypothetical protein DICPUDRAFT_151089 [Dictyostelium purpureum]|eukprot:XP_003287035.1 hypothetical protein DICPUDRAFT_151089 [Dictyostelium purpureum]
MGSNNNSSSNGNLSTLVMDRFNVRINSLAVEKTEKNANIYLVGSFDDYKQFRTESKKSSSTDGSAKFLDFNIDFQYETKFIHKLDRKHLKICVYKKKSMGTDKHLGSFQVDLYTLATGPISHDVIFQKDGLGIGRIQFRLEMSHINDVKFNIKSILLSNLQKMSNYQVEYSLGKPIILKTPVIEGTVCPSWYNQIPIVATLSLKELVDSHFLFTLKDMKQNKTIGSLQLPIKSIFSFIEGDSKIVKTKLYGVSKKQDVCDAFIEIQFTNIPQLAQFKDGIQTETGIRHAQPFFSGVPLPKLMGEITQQPTQASQIKLPAGWESRVDNFGRVYYIDHNTQQTTWTSPLNYSPVEKRQSSIITNGVIASPAKAARPTRSKEEAAIILQRTFRKKREYNKTIRNASPNNVAQEKPTVYQVFNENQPQLPHGWEVKMDPYGRVYFVDHINKVTTWTKPQLKDHQQQFQQQQPPPPPQQFQLQPQHQQQPPHFQPQPQPSHLQPQPPHFQPQPQHQMYQHHQQQYNPYIGQPPHHQPHYSIHVKK